MTIFLMFRILVAYDKKLKIHIKTVHFIFKFLLGKSYNYFI